MIILKIITDEEDSIKLGDIRRLPPYIPDETPIKVIERASGKKETTAIITFDGKEIVLE